MEKKKVLAVVLTVLFAVVGMNAQNVVTNINTRDAQACGEYLTANPMDTIQNQFNISKEGMRGVIKRSVYIHNSRLTAFNDTTWYRQKEVPHVNMDQVRKLDSLSVETRVVESLYDDQSRDVIYAYSEDVKNYRNAKNGDDSDEDAGKVVMKAANKYGWSVQAHAGYSYAKGVNGPVGGVGVTYERKWWGIYLNGEVGKSKLSSNAVNAGDNYWVFRAESALMFRPFQLDRLDQHRLFILGGVGFENYKTDSTPITTEDGQIGYLSSRGNYLYATFGGAYEYRFIGSGNALGARLQWRDTRATVQNSNAENFGSIVLSLYFKFGVFRNKVSLK